MSEVDREVLDRVSVLLRNRNRRSAGSAALSRVLRHVSQRDVAARLGTSPCAVSRWAAGVRLPSDDMRLLLAAVYAIPGESWDLDLTLKGGCDLDR